MDGAETYVARWQQAGLIDQQTATAIRDFEGSHALPRRRQRHVTLALILGAILLGAGVLLFVAAHWDQVSPAGRMVLVVSTLALFHCTGPAARNQFPGLATAMHAVGTVSAGAAIALVGQIFNMQEHWPSAVLLWALCAAAGWFLLRDQFQQTLTLLLVPAWIICEWADRTSDFRGTEVYLARMVAVIAAVYLVAFLHNRKRALSGILFGVAAAALPICTGILQLSWFARWNTTTFVPPGYRALAWAIMLLTVAAGWLLERQSLPPALVILGVTWVLPWAQTSAQRPTLLAYASVAAACLFLIFWGVRSSAKALVNYGVVGFALTVMWFYFSSLMDKLGRSLGLISLGVLFLAGGWALEKVRRQLVGGISPEAVA